MSLKRLKISHFRNISHVDIELSIGFNFFQGYNGSGKTSLLEAIYFLTHGKSFRTRLINRIISTEQPFFNLFCTFEQNEKGISYVGLERSRQGALKVKINSTDNCSIADLASLQPLLLLNPFTFHLLDAGPHYRRQFLDWVLFHVEHQFLLVWRKMQRALKQRNAALRTGNRSFSSSWNAEFVQAGLQVHEFRKHYLQKLIPVFFEILKKIDFHEEVCLNYVAGWDEEIGLNALLEQNYTRDSLLGYTQYGPHRADIVLKKGHVPAVEVFSRGEQKLLVYALRLAQGIVLKSCTGKNCMYLIDDLESELDIHNQQKLFALLKEMEAQIIVTSLTNNYSDYVENKNTAIFQVTKGNINPI